MWLEDMLTGDYVPWVNPQAYRELTISTSTPIHTGEQIYLRHNFKELIETQAVRVIGPDPADIGGIAELKWVAEHAYMHSIMMAPHGTANGLLGLGALINVVRHPAGQLHCLRIPHSVRSVVGGYRRRTAEADRTGFDDRTAAWPQGSASTSILRERASIFRKKTRDFSTASRSTTVRRYRRGKPGWWVRSLKGPEPTVYLT